MNKNGHAIGGFLIIGTCWFLKDIEYTNNQDLIEFSFISTGIFIGSFIPDIDADYSYIGSKVPLFPLIIKGLRKITKNTRFNNFFIHRGVMLHSIWTIVLLILMNILISLFFGLSIKYLDYNFNFQYIFNGLFLGILGHHFTRNGLRYFYPSNFKITKYKLYIYPVRKLKKRIFQKRK